MRKWISLLEYFGETLTQEEITDVYEIVQAYVTSGEGASTRKFAQVYEMLPRPDHSLVLHRVLRLTPDQMTQYRRDQTFELRPMEYSSWTKCSDAATLLAQTKGEHVIVITQEFPAWEIVIDIPEFYDEHELSHLDEYAKYVKPEQEVIVRHVTPLQVTAANSKAYDRGHLPHPMIGDEVFLFDSEDSYEIDDVDHEQPYAQRGLYTVSFDYWDNMTVRFIGQVNGRNQWEVVDHLVHE